MADERVYVEGLRDMRRALGEVDAELRKEFRVELKGVADIAARRMRAAVPFDGGKKQKGVAQHWRDKITAGASGSSAFVTWGRKTVPYAAWLEFGGNRRGRGGGIASRPRTPGGRFIYPQIARARPEVEQELRNAVERLLQRSGLD